MQMCCSIQWCWLTRSKQTHALTRLSTNQGHWKRVVIDWTPTVDAHNYYVTIDPKEGVQTMSGVCLAYSAAACNHHVDTSASQYVTGHLFLITETILLLG